MSAVSLAISGQDYFPSAFSLGVLAVGVVALDMVAGDHITRIHRSIRPVAFDRHFYGSEIHALVKNGKLAEVEKYLLAHPKEVSKKAKGLEPIHLAFQTENKKMVELLLNRGASLQALSDQYKYPIQYANGDFSAEYFEKFDFLHIDPQLKTLPLHEFVRKDPALAQKVISFGISAGINVPANIYGGATPLHLAVSNGYFHTASSLLEHGAQLDIQDDAGNTPLHLAIQAWQDDIVGKILDYGARIDLTNKKGETPLDVALAQGNYLQVCWLQQKGEFRGENPWRKVTLVERNEDGGVEHLTRAHYHLDAQTRDLYPSENSLLFLRVKALIASAIAPFYLPLSMVQQLGGMAIEILHPSKDLLWRLGRRISHTLIAPLCAIGMMFAGLYTFYDPLSGRKWMSRMAESWDEKRYLNRFGLACVGNVNMSTVRAKGPLRFIQRKA